ncbi:7-cyano-7-deazaguanine synthase [Thermococcus gammatolerans]|uniref:p-loop ATPase, MJ1599 type n=1 Tax=Thermococcus gammatolerans (strain DSM 15229 / JCM 11827 / EJ3) TaxID=593117 RepID=C5A340_THEGJ|nr:7-cyano-7-deazaguanine synthase [Thermococcus gammatolerans]ACS32652.1 P-loop ATPase, MJ1599 type [Thermococcus gammatolerans EJ3]
MLKCSLCVNDERTAKIDIIDGKPICRECQVYLKHPVEGERIRKELDELMKNVDKAIVAYSGGKDSVVALYLAKEVYKVPELEAVMIDHGLMAEEAIENARRIAEHLGVPFRVLRYDYSDIFRNALLKGQSPCRACSRRTMEKLRKYAIRKGYRYIITGHELPFGHHPYRLMSGGVIQIRLLSMMTEKERFEILKKLPFEFLELPGYTTNCLVLGPALELYWEKHGHSFEHRRIAALVRYGLMSRERAEKELQKPKVPEWQWEIVKKKLGIDFPRVP